MGEKCEALEKKTRRVKRKILEVCVHLISMTDGYQ